MLQVGFKIFINLILNVPNHEHDTLGYIFYTNHQTHGKLIWQYQRPDRQYTAENNNNKFWIRLRKLLFNETGERCNKNKQNTYILALSYKQTVVIFF